MGSPIGVLVQREKISLDHLGGRVVAIDAFNALYQFLSIIRLRDGTPLKDKNGRVTSHLSGLFYRTINLVEHGIRPVYIFDGKSPVLKERTLREREAVKVKFTKEWQEAVEKGDLSTAFKKSVMTSRLERGMVPEAHHLLDLLGVPWIDAPSEGEAQAAHMAKQGKCYAAASQDYDSLLFGSPRLIINLTIAGKRYYPKRGIAVNLIPELVELDKILSQMKLSHEELIDVGMLVGTDFNEGIYGMGPKRALQTIRKFHSLEKAAQALGWELDFDPAEIREFYLNPPVIEVKEVEWRAPSYSEIRQFMVMQKNFDAARVERGLERLKAAVESQRQSGLREWI
jgi:flap endonuclease-1